MSRERASTRARGEKKGTPAQMHPLRRRRAAAPPEGPPAGASSAHSKRTCHRHRVAQVAHAQGADKMLIHDLGLEHHIASLQHRSCTRGGGRGGAGRGGGASVSARPTGGTREAAAGKRAGGGGGRGCGDATGRGTVRAVGARCRRGGSSDAALPAALSSAGIAPLSVTTSAEARLSLTVLKPVTNPSP